MLDEARQVFPETHFPASWGLGEPDRAAAKQATR